MNSANKELNWIELNWIEFSSVYKSNLDEHVEAQIYQRV